MQRRIRPPLPALLPSVLILREKNGFGSALDSALNNDTHLQLRVFPDRWDFTYLEKSTPYRPRRDRDGTPTLKAYRFSATLWHGPPLS